MSGRVARALATIALFLVAGACLCSGLIYQAFTT
jgi:hypothetical protein